MDSSLADVLALGQLGVSLIDERQVVIQRHGALAAWMAPEGAMACSCPILFGMEEALDALAHGSAAPLTLASVRAPGVSAHSISISIVWSATARRLVALTWPDASARQIDRLVLQERRERQVLQQQAAAAAAQVAISTTLYRDIVETTGDAVLRLTPELGVSFVNGAAGHLLGLDPGGVLGRPVREVLPLPASANPWRRDMCARGAASFEQPARDRAGGTIWLWWDVRWLGDEDGPLEFQAVGRDVTQLRRLRAEVERAHEESRFAALARERLRIAHDLHDTLIHAIVNLMARLTLLRRGSPPGPLRDDLAAAEVEAREGLRNARQAVGEIRGGLDVPGGLGQALAAAAQKLREGGAMDVAIRLENDFSNLAPHRASAAMRVASEALRNIALHSGARNVTISSRLEDGRHVLDILDDGIGFDPGIDRHGHFGLSGMSEQSRLAGGELSLDSAPGRGVRLRLTIPRD